MDLGWAAQTFAPDSYMVDVETLVLSGELQNVDLATVEVSFDGLVDSPWDAAANKDAKASLYPSFQKSNDDTAVSSKTIDVGSIGHVFYQSTPSFNFSWQTSATFSSQPSVDPDVLIYLLFYPNPYFDQRF